jgi:hypothetical protein
MILIKTKQLKRINSRVNRSGHDANRLNVRNVVQETFQKKQKITQKKLFFEIASFCDVRLERFV